MGVGRRGNAPHCGNRGQCRAAAASGAATATAEDRCRVPERLPVLGRLLRARTEHQVQDDAEAHVDLPGRRAERCGVNEMNTGWSPVHERA